MMFLYQSPPLPWCTQWPAVQTRLLFPGCAGSAITVAEHWPVPSPFAVLLKIFPEAGVSVYGRGTATAWTGAGSGSVPPLPELSGEGVGGALGGAGS